MLAIIDTDKVKFPCKNCFHKQVCMLISKIEEIRVSIPDNHFVANIECSEFAPVLTKDDDEEYKVIYPKNEEEQA